MTAKRKTEGQRAYRFKVTVVHAPLGDREYPAGTVDPLKDWQGEEVAWALAAGLIEATEAASSHSEGDAEEEM